MMFIGLILALAYTGRLPAVLGVIPYYDTLGHFTLMGLSAWLAHRAGGRRWAVIGRLRFPLWPVVVAAVVVIEEALQALSPNRTSSWSDLAAGFLGMTLMVGFDEWRAKGRKPTPPPA